MLKIKLTLLAVIVLSASSCYKTPSLDELSLKPIVITNHDASINFGNYKTYYISDQVTKIGDDKNDSVVSPSISAPLINAIKNNMAKRGFTLVKQNENPDLGMTSAIITITTTVTSYPPSYWYGYPGYGWGGYYGGYYPYYGYGYSYSYSYQTGSLIIQMADFKNIENNKINMIWTNFNTGVMSENGSDVNAGVNAINQAFTQSPYIKTN